MTTEVNTHIYIARHGQTHWNKVHRFQGQLDSNLTAEGHVQSEKVAKSLQSYNIDLIFSSPLGRAIASANTCQQILNVPSNTCNNLLERSLGDWQGAYIKDIKTESQYDEILHQFTNLIPKNGESAVACGERIYQSLSLIAKQNQQKNLLIIFHGEALRCFFAKLGKSSNNNAYQLFDNGCMFHLTYEHASEQFTLCASI